MESLLSGLAIIPLAFYAISPIVLLYWIIGAATKANRRAKYDWAQMELLGKIARVQGVREEEIKAIFDAIK